MAEVVTPVAADAVPEIVKRTRDLVEETASLITRAGGAALPVVVDPSHSGGKRELDQCAFVADAGDGYAATVRILRAARPAVCGDACQLAHDGRGVRHVQEHGHREGAVEAAGAERQRDGADHRPRLFGDE